MLGVLQDVILASSMDDSLFSTLNAIIQFTNVEIVELVQVNPGSLHLITTRLLFRLISLL